MPALDSLTSRSRAVVLLISATGLLVTGLIWQGAVQSERERIHLEFRRRAEAQARLARERILLYQEMVFGLRSFFESQRKVSREEFRHVCARLLDRFPSVQAFQWVPAVAGDERADFENYASREAGRPFRIRSRLADGSFADAPERTSYLPILYVEPWKGNDAVWGYDLTDAPTASALALARKEDRLVVSKPFRLAQSRASDDQPGMVFVTPIFGTPELGQPRAFLGYIQCVFLVETMLSHPFRGQSDDALLSYYIDLSDGSPILLYANLAGREPLWEHAGPAQLPPLDDPGAIRETMNIGDRNWLLYTRINEAWLAKQRTIIPGLILIGGLVITALGAVLVHSLLQRNSLVERQVAEHTAELLTARQLLEDDIRQREETEQRLRESESRLQAILDNSPSPIFVKDLEGHYLVFNAPFAAACRRPQEQIFGRSDHELFPEEQARLIRANDAAVIAAGRVLEFEESDAGPGGTRTRIVQKFPLRDAEDRIYAIGGIATDITERVQAETERRELERRMQASQKLESLGVLAGGIAHDFNNILTAVLGNASLARQIAGPRNKAEPQLVQIETAARRAADLCQQMLAYAGKGRMVADRVDLSEIVRGTAALLEVSISKNTRLKLRLQSGLPAVFADATQLRQIVMNLVINAADAIGERPGLIELATFAQHCESALLASAIGHPSLESGLYVGLEVRDNGEGMNSETISRIFEPFFTTKFSGRGLGLSAALGIVQSHRGALYVDSRPGEGSTFRLLLPAVEGAVQPGDTNAVASPARLEGMVLVVDDESGVREIALAALNAHGARVVTAENGLQALDYLADPANGFALVLLDLTMPGLSGDETLRRLRAAKPEQAVILMSGYSETDAASRLGPVGATEFIQKPFDLDTLLRKVGPFLRPKGI